MGSLFYNERLINKWLSKGGKFYTHIILIALADGGGVTGLPGGQG